MTTTQVKRIDTLIQDIDNVILSGIDNTYPAAAIQAFGNRVASILSTRLLGRRDRAFTLRMSNLGKSDVNLWYEAHNYPKDEELDASALLKFLYGDIIEELLLTLAELAGHKVSDRQKEVVLDGIVGHIDAMIDDEIVDVKSASSQSFDRFQRGELKDNDSFGYYTQVSAYVKALGKDKGYFLCMDKTLGHTCTLKVDTPELVDVSARIKAIKEMLDNPVPPVCNCLKKVEANGNEYLTAPCSYSPYKHHYHTGLRTFMYSSGPRFFTKVVKQPMVPELIAGSIDDGQTYSGV